MDGIDLVIGEGRHAGKAKIRNLGVSIVLGK